MPFPSLVLTTSKASELVKNKDGNLAIYSAFQKENTFPNEPLPDESVRGLCLVTGKAIEEIIAIAPQFDKLLDVEPGGRPRDHREAVTAVNLVANTLAREHKRVCTDYNPRDDGLSSTLGWAFSSKRSNATTRTMRDFETLIAAPLLAEMAQNIMVRLNKDSLFRFEYQRLDKEMSHYVEQVKKYGLNGDRQLPDPKEVWLERIRGEIRKEALGSPVSITAEEAMREMVSMCPELFGDLVKKP